MARMAQGTGAHNMTRASTPAAAVGSGILTAVILAACGTGQADEQRPKASVDPSGPVALHAAAGETCLGVADKGIWSDLDGDLQIALPAGLTPARVSAAVDADHHLLVLSVDGWPTKPYPLGGEATLALGARTLALRPGDRAELAPLLTEANTSDRAAPAAHDRDRDGITDALDVLMGAKKTVLNADAYVGGYETLRYPMGDVPRERGVCTDVIVRSLRNAGLDLQAALHQDIARSKRSYPMVKGKGDANIDHRRVKTLLPFFKRHLEEHTAALDDARDPVRPGDLVLFDTFPSRSGPDHIGVVSDRVGESGRLLVINNWTDGTVTAEMDLLAWVPVTHRFRLAPRR